ncbi:TRAP transporter large permease [Salicibibacter cibarius]|uniref:TRAP transporter large permease n=1 Tax=Salicibibacter cibarius TaxID=2743000 RepID=A0A7T6Z1Q0_9BACI|nr:TRAP transporter large permease [Salicibibacter cibarius]QQK75375.1 TRAP transporter large permease [Salicibibacter cibarius]
MELIIGIILLVTIFALLLIGVPISFTVAIASALAMLVLFSADVAVFTTAQQMLSGLDSFTLLAIPFFILAGVIMNNGGIAQRLINLAKVLIGRMPGSLVHTNIVGNMLFGSLSGSAVASAAAVGGVLTPTQKKEGYDPKFTAAANIASAPTGMIIPPSIALIVYSTASGGTSIAALFIAGYIPGILWGLATLIVAYIVFKKKSYGVNIDKISLKEGFNVFFSAFPSLLLIFIVIGGIVAGIFTATEAAAIAVLYASILSFIYKTIRVKDIPKMLKETVEMSGVIMFLVAASTILSIAMTFSGIPPALSEIILSVSDNLIVILILMNIILLLIGAFMDITPALLIFTPIFLPIATELGLDPVHFGIVLVMNLSIGMITPPVGSVLFVGSNVGKVPIESLVKPLSLFYVAIIAMLLVVTFFPQISMFLPNLFEI